MTTDLRATLGLAMREAGLPCAARFVGQQILSHRNRETGQSRPSIELLSKETGIDARELRRLIRALENTGIVATTQRSGRASLYSFPAFPPDRGSLTAVPTPGASYPGHQTPGVVHQPRVQDTQGPPLALSTTPGTGLPDTPGTTYPPELKRTKELQLQHAKSRHPSSLGPGPAADADMVLEILKSKLDSAGLNVRWDRLTAEDRLAIAALAATHGDAALVRCALNQRAGHDQAPLFAQAWLPGWLAMPLPGVGLAAVPDPPCGVDGHPKDRSAASCPTCRSDALEARGGAPKTYRRPE